MKKQKIVAVLMLALLALALAGCAFLDGLSCSRAMRRKRPRPMKSRWSRM